MSSESRTPRAMSFFGFLASSPNDVMDSNPHSRKIAIVAWSITELKPCGATTDHALGWAGASPLKAWCKTFLVPSSAIPMEPSGCPTRCRIASTVKISSAVIWMALIVKFVTRRGLDSAVRDVSDPESRDNCYQRHEDRTGSAGIDNVREEDANDVANHDPDGAAMAPGRPSNRDANPNRGRIWPFARTESASNG